eukprot:TRINITY_DN1618_c0_g1_i1.p1 TRINITY_DN1618_c0_g1~~TRINITY_DN1618_c0_g1_i1.p1  ORF type:complete len:398 (+),score=53.03 TRINITY_DN1618_c0_g1_i1:317-1510(+)
MEKHRKDRGRRFYTLMQSCCRSEFISPVHYVRSSGVEEEHEATRKEESSGIEYLPDDLLMECLARLPRSSVHSAMMVSRRFNMVISSPSYYEVRKRLDRLEGLLFVFGGAGTGLRSAVFSKKTGSWGSGLLFSPHFLQGKRDCSTIVYDAWKKTLTRRAPMICLRKKFACCAISGRIFVAGGALINDSKRRAIVDAEMYIPELDVWKPIPNMPRKRYGCLGAAVNGIFYVIGGLKFGNMNALSVQPYAYVSSMDAFDTKTNTWLRTKPLPLAMGGCVISCTVVDSCIYMLSRHAVALSFWKYATESDTWMRMKPPPIPSPLRLDNVLKFSCVTLGSSVYVIQVGGSVNDLLRRNERRNVREVKEGLVVIFDTKLKIWKQGPFLPYTQNGAACAVVEC